MTYVFTTGSSNIITVYVFPHLLVEESRGDCLLHLSNIVG